MISLVGIFSTRFIKSKNKILPNIGVLMSFIAITISVSILIIVISVMNGFRDELLKKILGFNSHITIYKKYGNFADFQNITKKAITSKNIISITPVVNGSGMLSTNSGSSGVVVKGINRNDIKNRQDFAKYIQGDLTKFKNFSIIVGKGIARELRLYENDEVNLIVPIISNTAFGSIPRFVNLKVIGFLKTNAQQYDDYMVLLPFNTAQKVFNLQESASALEVITANPNDVAENTFFLQQQLGRQDLYFSNWQIENHAMINALNIEANVMGLILSLFIIISMFTIFAVIRMMIKSKEREIAILKSHGISNTDINKIFLIIGLSIAICGMIIGNIAGISIALNIENIRMFLEKLLNVKLLDGSVYLLSKLPSKVIISDIIRINIFAFTMAVICTLISTYKNTKIDVVNILRNN